MRGPWPSRLHVVLVTVRVYCQKAHVLSRPCVVKRRLVAQRGKTQTHVSGNASGGPFETCQYMVAAELDSRHTFDQNRWLRSSHCSSNSLYRDHLSRRSLRRGRWKRQQRRRYWSWLVVWAMRGRSRCRPRPRGCGPLGARRRRQWQRSRRGTWR